MKKSTKILALTVMAFSIFSVTSVAKPSVYAATPTLIESQQEPAILTISGSAMRQVAPDYAVLNLGLVTKGSTVSEAKSKNDVIMSQLMEKLQNVGITKNNITTENFSVNPNYQYNNNEDGSKISYYTVSNRISVRINDLSKVSRIIDLAAKCGINEIDSLTFYTNKENAIEDQLTVEAVNTARHKADVLAKAVGMKIAGVKNISMNPTHTVRDSNGLRYALMATSAPIETGQLTLEKIVNITYYLK